MIKNLCSPPPSKLQKNKTQYKDKNVSPRILTRQFDFEPEIMLEHIRCLAELGRRREVDTMITRFVTQYCTSSGALL